MHDDLQARSQQRPLGTLIGTYGLGRTMYVRFWVAALGIIGVGVVGLGWVLQAAASSHVTGGSTVIDKACYVLIALGLVFAVAPVIAGFFGTRFHLYDNAIRAVGRRKDRTDYFEDIEDLFVHHLGGISYRASAGDPWTLVHGHVQDYAKLKALFSEKLIEHRGERLYAELMAGQRASFHCVGEMTVLQKTWLGAGRVKPADDITLTARHLAINGKRIEVRRISAVSINRWSERAKILSVDGEVFHQMHVTAVMSLDVLCALLARLQGDRAVIETAERQSRLHARPTGDTLTRPH